MSAAAAIATRLSRPTGNAPRIPVFSPIFGAYYPEIDSPGDSFAAHLVEPIRFLSALRTLSAHGVNTFQNCGVLKGIERSTTRAAGALVE